MKALVIVPSQELSIQAASQIKVQRERERERERERGREKGNGGMAKGWGIRRKERKEGNR